MTLSEKAWGKTINVYEAIINHPFNQELIDGTLDYKKFSFYIKQDFLFLKEFARSLALIAAKTDSSEYIEKFLQFANSAIIAEQTIIAKYLKDSDNCNSLSPACLSYGNFLLRISALEPVEVAISAILPCFYIYQKIGQHAYKYSKPNNPFSQWIDTYASNEFAQEVETITIMFDKIADSTSRSIQEKMSKAFYQSSILQYYFWDDSYKLKVYDKVFNP